MPRQTGFHSASTLFLLLSRALLVRRWHTLLSCLRRPTSGSDTGVLPCTTRDHCCCQHWGPKGRSSRRNFTGASFTTAAITVATITARQQWRLCSLLGPPSGSSITAEPTRLLPDTFGTSARSAAVDCLSFTHTHTGLVLMGRPLGFKGASRGGGSIFL